MMTQRAKVKNMYVTVICFPFSHWYNPKAQSHMAIKCNNYRRELAACVHGPHPRLWVSCIPQLMLGSVFEEIKLAL